MLSAMPYLPAYFSRQTAEGGIEPILMRMQKRTEDSDITPDGQDKGFPGIGGIELVLCADAPARQGQAAVV